MKEIGNAIHWWLCENCRRDQEVFRQTRGLLEYFFHCADSLYSASQRAGLPEAKDAAGAMSTLISGRRNVVIVNRL